MQAIKALVVGMGILLVAGVGLLGYGVYMKTAKRAPATVELAPGAAFGTVALPLAPGGRLVAIAEAGGRLAVLVDEGGAQRIVVVDPAGGAVLGEFVPAPRR